MRRYTIFFIKNNASFPVYIDYGFRFEGVTDTLEIGESKNMMFNCEAGIKTDLSSATEFIVLKVYTDSDSLLKDESNDKNWEITNRSGR